jgi:DNA-binding NarL/FixJ family response regulator
MVLQDRQKLAGDFQGSLSPEHEVLLKHLVHKIAAIAPRKVLKDSDETINEIMIESDVDGVHYCLIRCKSRSKQPIALSPRELAIARLIAQGFPNKCIGSTLNISPWTVSTHLRRIFSKLGVTSRAAMVARLMEENLLQSPEYHS